MGGLMRYKPGTTQLEPYLAESYEIKDNGTVYMFHLRKDPKFADGTPCTAYDVVRSIKRVMRIQGDPSWLVTDFVKDVKDWKPIRRFVQMIFQDPYASLNPKMSIGEHLTEPLIVHGFDKDEAFEEAIKMLERVGLTPAEEFYSRFPWQLSGGQRQRVAIARAMILRPKLVVADEPVSMIDVSLRASILNLLMSFKSEYGLSMLFISHDLSVSRLISDGIAVMYLGKIVEMGDVDSIIENPLHPYTKALRDKRGRPKPQKSA